MHSYVRAQELCSEQGNGPGFSFPIAFLGLGSHFQSHSWAWVLIPNPKMVLGPHSQSPSWAWVLIPNPILGPGSSFPVPFLGLGSHSQSHSSSSFAPNKPYGFCGRRASTMKERKKERKLLVSGGAVFLVTLLDGRSRRKKLTSLLHFLTRGLAAKSS